MRVGWQRRSAGDVEFQPRVGGIDALAVEADQTRRIFGPDRRVAAQILTRTGKFECQVDQRREQHQRGRAVGGDVGLQQQVDRQMAAGRIACDHNVFRAAPALVSQSQPARTSSAAVGKRCRGAKPVVDGEHRQPGQPREPRRQSAVGARRAQREAAAVDEVDGAPARRDAGRAHPLTDDATPVVVHVDVLDAGPGQ